MAIFDSDNNYTMTEEMEAENEYKKDWCGLCSPENLATAIFPHPIGGDKASIESLFAINGLQLPNHKKPGRKIKADTIAWSIKSGANYVAAFMAKYYGLELAYNPGSKKLPIAPSMHAQNRWDQGSKTCLFCEVCWHQDNRFEPVVLANIDRHEKAIQVTHVFFHQSHGIANVQQYDYLERAGFAIVSFDLGNILGPAFEKAYEKLKELEANSHKDKSDLGAQITFGFRDDSPHRADDRTYINLPDDSLGLGKAVWQNSLLRLLYNVSCRLGMGAEIGTFTHSVCTETKEILSQANDSHLHPAEPTLIFKGNALADDQAEAHVVHQIPHTDCSGLNQWKVSVEDDGTKKAVSKKFGPMSVICPISTSGRRIYFGSPDNLVKIDKNQYLVFRGNMTHGGATEIAARGQDDFLRPAVHLHIDSYFHEREKAILDFEMEHDMFYKSAHLTHAREEDSFHAFQHCSNSCFWVHNFVEISRDRIVKGEGMNLKQLEEDQSITEQEKGVVKELAKNLEKLLMAACGRSLHASSLKIKEDLGKAGLLKKVKSQWGALTNTDSSLLLSTIRTIKKKSMALVNTLGLSEGPLSIPAAMAKEKLDQITAFADKCDIKDDESEKKSKKQRCA